MIIMRLCMPQHFACASDRFTSSLRQLVHDIAPLIIYCVCHEASKAVSWRWIVFHNGFDLLLVGLAISLEKVVGIGLRRRIRVWIVEQILDAEEDLFDGDGWLPALFFVQD